MKITIKNKEIELKYSFRALMLFEKKFKQSFTGEGGITELINFMYCIVISSARGKADNITLDDFIDFVDDNPKFISEFTQWLNDVMTANNYTSEVMPKEVKDKGVEKKK